MTQSRKALIAALQQLSGTDSDHWSYKRMGQRPGLHGLVRYPAMMVPQMQGDLIDAVTSTTKGINKILDPFVGSGTTLLEAVSRGICFEGFDINPLAILICQSKLLRLKPTTVSRRFGSVFSQIADDTASSIDVKFNGRDKWFTKNSCIELSKIRRAIAKEENKQLRKLMWTVLAETIRKTSLSRETTYKLHIRPSEEAKKLESPIVWFKKIAADAIERYEYQYIKQVSKSLRKTPTVHLACRDIRNEKNGDNTSQLILTSPPYGDNETTIPYGQFSYLALNWIINEDLEGDPDLYDSAYAIDRISLGGSKKDYQDNAIMLCMISKSFEKFFTELLSKNRHEFQTKAANFSADLFEATGSAISKLDRNGLAIWTIGERSIGGLQVPLANICSEINEFFGMTPVTRLSRRILSKRMPHRTSAGKTMINESILVMQKT